MGPPILLALQRIRGLEKSSPDFADRLKAALYGDEYVECLRNIEDDDLVWLVDYLDETLRTLDPFSLASRKCLRELRTICGTEEILPTSYTLPPNILTVEPTPFCSGGFGDIHHGTLDGSRVCIKRIRLYGKGDQHKAIKLFCQEAVVWKRLTHPNILPLLGITPDPLQLVSSWMPGGSLSEYVKTHSDPRRLELLSDVITGICYFHSCNVIHGDLKGPNILVDESGRARIADFGLATVTHHVDSLWMGSLQSSNTPRWTAPEILNGARFSREADIFSFAMVMIEVFTGAVPFSDGPGTAAIVRMIQAERPPRPTHPSFTDDLWILMQSCWNHNPKLRPNASEVLKAITLSLCKRFVDRTLPTDDRACLITAVFSKPDQAKMARQVPSEEAQNLIDVIYGALDTLPLDIRKKCLCYLYRVCGREGLVPQSMTIPLCFDPRENAWCNSEFADVWKGRHLGNDVAAKVLRVYQSSSLEEIRKRFCKEVVLWKGLRHPNVLPLLGVTMAEYRFVLVSEWMEYGNINEFVKEHPDENRLELLADATRGLIYMHVHGIIHGNLRGSNIVVNHNGRGCLADTGLFTVTPEDTITSVNQNSTRAQWVSPELLFPEKFGLKKSQPTKASDCYSLGMTVYEVLSGQTPFTRHTPATAVWIILEGGRPERPEGAQGEQFTDDIWGTLEFCWQPRSEDRIHVRDVLLVLEGGPCPLERSSEVDEDLVTDGDDQSDTESNFSLPSSTHSDDPLLGLLETGNGREGRVGDRPLTGARKLLQVAFGKFGRN